ncbi:BamA/TamA family outer membrane protein [Flavobacterium beibuense]|uniref:Surface antigen (D15) n=1 Tax=Flavobacterium beibuense TaxID=657326 RepID=A0A444WC54_9FLAO|nr:BamA/TamA family outer membrane protein [Flavobacterium beibuense]RYJ43402.1 Surface antigen (D15) [Flavobacterium beibuense]
MRNKITKIALIILSASVLFSCSLTKRVPDSKQLLKEVDINVNDKSESKNEDVTNQLYQIPNSDVLGLNIRLHLYNWANPNPDSSYQAWLERKPNRHKRYTALLSEKQVQRLGHSFIVSGIDNFLKDVGEPPVIVDSLRTQRSARRLNAYYFKRGYFRTKVKYTIDSIGNKRARVTYNVETGKPYIVDSISTQIQSPVLDSLYNKTKDKSIIKKGKQYAEADFTEERDRLTTYFLNHGVYNFQPNYISYAIDTVGTNYKANAKILIDNETVRTQDSTYTKPFSIYKISQVNIYTENQNGEERTIDSASYKGFNIYSTGKLNYRPKALTDPVFITPGSTYADFRRTLTYRYLSNLNIFYYPKIIYEPDPADSTGTSLITNIYLKPKTKFDLIVGADFIHSNIQDFGIQGNLTLLMRNVFRGAEILSISTRGNVGSSRDLSIQDRSFFNILEYGADLKLTFPRIFFPLNTDRIIRKEMIPSTNMSFGTSRQQNIGLDKESFTGILSYNWTPKRNVTARLDLLNIQYVRNVNPQNYFNVYASSYERLNDYALQYQNQVDPNYFAIDPETGETKLIIEEGTDGFINDVDNGTITVGPEDYRNINSIDERKQRLTENNLIFASNFTYTTSTKENILDNTFFIFKTKIESAGNFLSLLSRLEGNSNTNDNGRHTFLNVEYSQYIKTEFDFIKHFDLRRGKVLAMRAFAGIAIPYGNANSIPFTRSYFGGGSNDNRAWQSYSLGPGRSGSPNDFNEANFKLAYSAELRFNLFGQLNGAIFGDVGNIWNVFDSETDTDYTFNGLQSFRDLAFGTGFGFRYDFNFFVVRLDFGYKTYDPGRPENDRWFKGYNFSKTVLNVGINYPF